jgi:hypothetical protein
VNSCATCLHLDAGEGVTFVSWHGETLMDMAGVCTRPGWYFNGKHVPEWFGRGCPKHEPIASPQGDGDPGGVS